MKRLTWWFLDLLDAIEDSSNAKRVGALALVALLAGGGYIAADKVSKAGTGAAAGGSTRLVTTVRTPVTVRNHGHTVVRWRLRRRVAAAPTQTVMQRETVKTPGGTKVITRPVVTYREKFVTVGGKTSTAVVPQTVTDSRTRTEVRTVTQPVTVVQTRTVVSTATVTLPAVTVTVTLPIG